MTTHQKVFLACESGLDCHLVEQAVKSLLPAVSLDHFLTGEELIARLEPLGAHEKPDLVIMDLFLPDFSGLELAEVITKLGCCKDLSVLILGGLPTDYVEQAKALRPEWYYLQKADSLDEMESNLKAALEDILGVSS